VNNDPVNSVDPHATMDEPDDDFGDFIGPKAVKANKKAAHEAEKAAEHPHLFPKLEVKREALPAPVNPVQAWRSVKKFERPLTKGELVLAVRKAYRQLEDSSSKSTEGGKHPSVMTAFAPKAMPGTVFFSSSATMPKNSGIARKYYEDESQRRLQTLSQDTKTATKFKEHKSGGCGELEAIDLALATNKDMALDGMIVTYGLPMNPRSMSQLETHPLEPIVLPPCCGSAKDSTFGCSQLLKKSRDHRCYYFKYKNGE
jgi:hypothetical protein